MASEQPDFVEVYAWNEPVLSVVSIVWGTYISSYGMGFTSSAGHRDTYLLVIGIVVIFFGAILFLVQSSRLRTFVDFTLPVYLISVSPRSVRPFILRMWPASTTTRTVSHFFFCWWWMLCGIAVLRGMSDINDSRFILYIGFSLLHFDRLVRIIQWMRK